MSIGSLRRGLLAMLLVGLGLPSFARAQEMPDDLAAQVAALRREVQQLREELAAMRTSREVTAAREAATPRAPDAPVLPAPLTAPEPGQTPPGLSPSDPALELLQQQVAELAQTKVESSSRMPIRLFGTLHAHAFGNSSEANWLDSPNIVPLAPAGGATGTHSMSLRQTRLGLLVDGPGLGAFRTSGTAMLDFFGGIPGFQTGQVMPIPRLVVGFVRLATDRTALQVGQDHVVLAPRDPTSLAALAFPGLFRSGNLYLRAPHVRLEHAFGGGVRAAAALVAPVGGDVPGEEYRFVPPAAGGERSRRPGVQARVGWTSSDDEEAPRFGSVAVSAHQGGERRGADTASTWAAAVDFGVRRDRIGVVGELFTGDNVDAFGGGTGLDARASGGWAELQVFPTARLSLHGGGGLDRLRDDGLVRARRRNRSAYGVAMYALTPELRTSVEYRWLETQPGTGPTRRNHHVDWVLAYTF